MASLLEFFYLLKGGGGCSLLVADLQTKGRNVSFFLGRPEGSGGNWFRWGHLASVGICFLLICFATAFNVKVWF